MNLLGEVINSNVAGRRHKHLPLAHTRKMIHYAGRRDSLASARRTLYYRERLLQHSLHRIHLVSPQGRGRGVE